MYLRSTGTCNYTQLIHSFLITIVIDMYRRVSVMYLAVLHKLHYRILLDITYLVMLSCSITTLPVVLL